MKTRILLMLLFVSSFAFAQVPSDEVRHYSFTGGSLVNTANPGTGDLTQSGSAATFVADHYGSAGNAIELNGDQFNGGSVSSTSSSLSLSFWIKPTSITTHSNWERILQIYAGSKGFRLEQKSGNLFGWSAQASTYVGGSSGRSSQLNNLYDNNWHHIVLKIYERAGYNGRMFFDVYIDGTKNVALSGHNVLGTGGNFLTNGSLVISPSSVTNYKKSIDDIKVFSRALSDTEISALYNLCESCYSLVTNVTGNGSIVLNPAPSSDNTYVSGTSVTLTATPDTSNLFNNWSGDASGTSTSTTIVIDQNKSVTANFIEAPVYVNINATGNNDGTTWANGYTDLQTAINNTATSKEIWVAKGIYIPSGNGRAATFNASKKQKIYGGFQGNESTLGDRDMSLLYTTNATILSGDLNGDDNATILDSETTRQDNAYHVVTIKGNFASGGELNGFIITGGNSNGSISNSCSTASTSQYDRRVGGAIYTNPDGENFKVYTKITNCIIEKNTGTYYAALGRFSPCGDQGTQSHVDFESCVIRDNYSASSANIAYTGSQQYNIRSYGTIVNSLITGNSNGASDKSSALIISSGGGSGSNPSALVSVINTTIANNTSANNKAVTINLKSASSYPVYFYNSIIYNNGGSNSINILGTNGSSATFANNIIEGGDYSSNASDPMLRGDFKLLTGSPAIDAGDNSKISSNITKDLEGSDRIQNTTIDIGAYEFGSSPLSTENVSFLSEISMYPNPVTNNLFIRSNQEIQKIEVYNLLGKKIIEKENSSSINLSNLASSMYLVRVYSQKGIVSKRIIKK
ncbi:MAG: T9SS type A sorting domain-containing protein [Polaribacter sp.]|uniref:T9SS type A sorting domain-containing protein n=1 Tax=Polaribacter sp. TaxID=1920175 RepID=UPI003BAF278B